MNNKILSKYRTIDKITFNERYIIDYCNIKEKLVNQNSFLSNKKIKEFYKFKIRGIPLLLPIKLSTFLYKNEKFFNINKKDFAKNIFNDNKYNYPFSKLVFKYGNSFVVNGKPKKKYNKLIKDIFFINKNLRNKIKTLKEKNKIIGAFQTRNIPHLGHEKIIEEMLKKCDELIINPVIGPKKPGDVSCEILLKSYEFLNKKYYNNKLHFNPICANMFYAGPREALHHTIIRQNLGFDLFSIGRDHAGSNAFYDPEAAVKLILRHKNKLKIKLLTHNGAYFDKTTKNIVLVKKFIRDKHLNIEGNKFRQKLFQKKYFKFARKDLQEYLYDESTNFLK